MLSGYMRKRIYMSVVYSNVKAVAGRDMTFAMTTPSLAATSAHCDEVDIIMVFIDNTKKSNLKSYIQTPQQFP